MHEYGFSQNFAILTYFRQWQDQCTSYFIINFEGIHHIVNLCEFPSFLPGL